MSETPLTENTETEISLPVPKKVELVHNWRKVLRTYSFWTMLASVLLSFVEQVLPFMGLIEPTMSGTAYGLTLFALNLSAIIFRMIKQKKLFDYPEEPKDGSS